MIDKSLKGYLNKISSAYGDLILKLILYDFYEDTIKKSNIFNNLKVLIDSLWIPIS